MSRHSIMSSQSAGVQRHGLSRRSSASKPPPATAPHTLGPSVYVTEWEETPPSASQETIHAGNERPNKRSSSATTIGDDDVEIGNDGDEEKVLLQCIASSRAASRAASHVDTSDSSDTDLEDSAYGQRRHYVAPVDVYHQACKRYHVIPSTQLIHQLRLVTAHEDDLFSQSICMNHKALDANDLAAVLTPVLFIDTLDALELAGNQFGNTGIQHLTDVMCNQVQVKKLDISDNNLGSQGAQAIGQILLKNDNICCVKAGGNRFRERDALPIVEALQNSYRLTDLDLSHNEFREDGGYLLGHVLARNDSVRKLNLSWNHLRLKGALAIAAGLKLNDTLQELDLSWNGFANDGAKALGEALSTNSTLLVLDLTSNRINALGADVLASGFKHNVTLQTLRLNMNPITSTGVLKLMTVIKDNRESALSQLEVKETAVTYDVEVIVDEIRESRPFRMQHGKFVKTADVLGQRLLDVNASTVDPFKLLMVYCQSEGLRLWDLFAQFDKDGSLCISPEEFKVGVKLAQLPITDLQLSTMVKRIDVNEDGQIDFGELQSHRKEFVVKERKRQSKNSPVAASDIFSMTVQLAKLELNTPRVSPTHTRPASPDPGALPHRKHAWKVAQTKKFSTRGTNQALKETLPVVTMETADEESSSNHLGDAMFDDVADEAGQLHSAIDT